MNRVACIAVLSAALLAPRAAAGQDAPERATALSLRPFGETTIGVWRTVSPRLEIGMEVGASLGALNGDDDSGGQSRRSFTVAPGAKLYGAGGDGLRPYGFLGASFQSNHIEYGDVGEATSNGLGASVGLGLEWSPVARVRVGGHAGVQALRATLESSGGTDDDGGEAWQASTYTTGLTVYYSF